MRTRPPHRRSLFPPGQPSRESPRDADATADGILSPVIPSDQLDALIRDTETEMLRLIAAS